MFCVREQNYEGVLGSRTKLQVLRYWVGEDNFSTLSKEREDNCKCKELSKSLL